MNCLEFSQKRTFGVELEMGSEVKKIQIANIMTDYELAYGKDTKVTATSGSEGWSNTQKNNYWHVKFDRSCHAVEPPHNLSGWEVASYIAKGLEDVAVISNAAGYLRSRGVKDNVNCGLHVHCDISDFKQEDAARLVSRWVKVEDVLFALCQERRSTSNHCKHFKLLTTSDGWKNISSENAFSLGQEIVDMFSDKNSKYRCLNFYGYSNFVRGVDSSRPTVELRLPEGDLDSKHVKFWTMLYVNMVDFAKTNKSYSGITPANSLNEFLFCIGLYSDESNFISPELMDLKIELLGRIKASKFNEFDQEIDQYLSRIEVAA